MNTIADRQNSEDMLRLMKARQQIYYHASILQVTQVVVAVILPLVGAAIAILLPQTAPFVALGAISAGILDTAIIDRLLGNSIRLAARIAEQFDCGVLDLDPNPLLAGRLVPPETIARAAEGYDRRQGSVAELQNWYPVAASEAPLHLGRLICQRSNIWYDGEVRKAYGSVALAFCFIGIGLVAAFALLANPTVTTLFVTVLPPAAPVFNWAAREYFRQRDASLQQESLREEVDALWGDATSGACREDDCKARSRTFQDAIFVRRATSPLTLPGVYGLVRSRLETQMNRGAEMLASTTRQKLDPHAP